MIYKHLKETKTVHIFLQSELRELFLLLLGQKCLTFPEIIFVKCERMLPKITKVLGKRKKYT